MPIKRLQRQDAVFPRIGILRKGAPKPATGNKPGLDLNHFRFDTDDADAERMFRQAYGDEPRQINIYLPYDTTEENFQVWQEAYVAGGLKHRCDGETCVIWQKPDGTYSQEPTPCPGGCKEVGRLAVIIPELLRMAYVTVETHSINDILQLTSNLQAAQAMRGSLKGMPLTLTRRAQEISTPGPDGKRLRRTKWLLFLEPHPEWVRVQLEVMHRRALGVSGDGFAPLPQLTDTQSVAGPVAYTDDDDDDGDVVDATPTDNPFAEEPVAEPEPAPRPQAAPLAGQATRAQLNTLHALGLALYGNDKATWDAKRPQIVEHATKGRTRSSQELWQAEAATLIAKFEDRARVAYASAHDGEMTDLAGVELAKALRQAAKAQPQPADAA